MTTVTARKRKVSDAELESKFQAHLIAKLKVLYPGCIILKNDSSYQQGIPDITIFFRDRWAALELKAHQHAVQQPNQAWFIETLNNMSFAAFIFPENEEDVLDELQQSFSASR